jgi:FkbM family methyltransferase
MEIKKLLKKYFGSAKRALPADGKPFTAELHGVKLELDPNEYIDSSLYQDSFEPDTIKAFKKIIRPGIQFIDIGANIGFFSLLVAKHAGKNGKVVAFEPTRYGFDKTSKNLALNSFHNITLEKIALSDKNDEAEMFFNASWPIDNQFEPKEKIPEKLRFETLDWYVKRMNIPNIDLIKIDVDGFEFKILKGARETLAKMSPLIILEICGYTLKRNGDSIKDIVDYLLSFNYSFYSEKNFEPITDLQSELINNPLFEKSSINVIVSKKKLNYV